MGTKAKFATWYSEGRILKVRPPGWPKNVELSFTDKRDMLQWAQNEHVMLRDGNRERRIKHDRGRRHTDDPRNVSGGGMDRVSDWG